MKNRKSSKAVRLICAVLSFALIFCVAALPAYAADESVKASADTELYGDKTESADTGENVFELLYRAVCDYINEIMCALTLAGSLVLALLYKRGLMPFMTRTVGAIGSTVAGMKASADSYAEKNGIELNEIKAALAAAQDSTSNFAERLNAIDGSLKNISTDKQERAVFKAALECQSALLYEILMHSSIPQYQKDAVGEKLGAIKASISSMGSEDGK